MPLRTTPGYTVHTCAPFAFKQHDYCNCQNDCVVNLWLPSSNSVTPTKFATSSPWLSLLISAWKQYIAIYCNECSSPFPRLGERCLHSATHESILNAGTVHHKSNALTAILLSHTHETGSQQYTRLGIKTEKKAKHNRPLSQILPSLLPSTCSLKSPHLAVDKHCHQWKGHW